MSPEASTSYAQWMPIQRRQIYYANSDVSFDAAWSDALGQITSFSGDWVGANTAFDSANGDSQIISSEGSLAYESGIYQASVEVSQIRFAFFTSSCYAKIVWHLSQYRANDPFPRHDTWDDYGTGEFTWDPISIGGFCMRPEMDLEDPNTWPGFTDIIEPTILRPEADPLIGAANGTANAITVKYIPDVSWLESYTPPDFFGWPIGIGEAR